MKQANSKFVFKFISTTSYRHYRTGIRICRILFSRHCQGYSKEAYCEVKIKEKGLTGKSADFRRRGMLGNPSGRKGFNAFREMVSKDRKETTKEKPEVFLDFMGKRLKVQVDEESGEGKIDEDEFENQGEFDFIIARPPSHKLLISLLRTPYANISRKHPRKISFT